MKKNAFTIVETLVTLLAITLMISAPLAFMYRSYNYSEIVRNKIISTGLAQEGLELFTSKRNLNLFDFQNLIADCTPVTNGGCMVDWDGISDSPTIEPCIGDECQLFSSSVVPTILYSKSGDTATGFYRYVTATSNGSQSYSVESVSYSYVNGIRVEVVLKKIISNIVVK